MYLKSFLTGGRIAFRYSTDGVGLPVPSILCDNFIFGWQQQYKEGCPYPNGYTYSNGEIIFFPGIRIGNIKDI